MKLVIINNSEVIVVGNFYAIDGDIKPRLNAAYAGTSFTGYLREAFKTNIPEDYESLKSHENPTVRFLVLRNLECIDSFLADKDIGISKRARLISALHKPLDDTFFLTPNY